MSTIEHVPRILLDVRRCYDCGRYWAIETSVNGTCPKCAHDEVSRARRAEDKACRAVAALRGALTKAKAPK